jgi:hypothetical protein
MLVYMCVCVCVCVKYVRVRFSALLRPNWVRHLNLRDFFFYLHRF